MITEAFLDEVRRWGKSSSQFLLGAEISSDVIAAECEHINRCVRGTLESYELSEEIAHSIDIKQDLVVRWLEETASREEYPEMFYLNAGLYWEELVELVGHEWAWGAGVSYMSDLLCKTLKRLHRNRQS